MKIKISVLTLSLIVVCAIFLKSPLRDRSPASGNIPVVDVTESCSDLVKSFKRNISFDISNSSKLVKEIDELGDNSIVSSEIRKLITDELAYNIYFKNNLNREYADIMSSYITIPDKASKEPLKSKMKDIEDALRVFSNSGDIKSILDMVRDGQTIRKEELYEYLPPELLDRVIRENDALFSNNKLNKQLKGDTSDALSKINKQSVNLSSDTLEELEQKLLDIPGGKEVVDKAAETFAKTGNFRASINYIGAALNMDVKHIYVKAKYKSSAVFGKKVYRPTLDFFRSFLEHVGTFYRKYLSKQSPEREMQRWTFVEKLHETGKIGGSFGHYFYKGWVDILGGKGVDDMTLTKIHRDYKQVGRDVIMANGDIIKIKPMKASAMMNISGMSFPQLSAESHITLLATQAKLTKDKGIQMTVNTGEGGPMFHLALLDGDVKKLREEVIYWGLETGDFKPGTLDMYEVQVRIDEIMKLRDQVLNTDQVKSSKIVAQFGTALNGIRSKNGFEVDFDKLKEIGEHPNVAMIQFKLDQAAKRGSKVDMNKVDAITAAMRKIDKSSGVKSPKSINEYTNEELAKLITATKMVTKKPVSLKIAPGDLNFQLTRLKYLRDHNALPDHIQVDGNGTHFSGGSGNAPEGASVSMTTQMAVISMDGILKKLGVRDLVHIEASGSVMYPQDAIEMMALGADDVSSARFWMGSALGCGRVQQCANGSCPYGIAAKNSIFAKGLDPQSRSDKAIKAATAWHNFYVEKIAEMGVKDWRTVRSTHGLSQSAPEVLQRIKKRDDNGEQIFLKSYYEKYVYELLSPIMTKDEIDHYILGDKAKLIQ